MHKGTLCQTLQRMSRQNAINRASRIAAYMRVRAQNRRGDVFATSAEARVTLFPWKAG
jgi:hypothetical protein